MTAELRQAGIPRYERALVLGLWLAIAAAAVLQQTPARIFADAKEYHTIAYQYATGATHVSARAPFVYRVATPWLAAQVDAWATPTIPVWLEAAIEESSGLNGVPGWYVVNLAATLAATWLLVSYLRIFVHTPGIRVLLVALWLMQWQAPLRYTFFVPVNIEPLFLTAVLATLVALEGLRQQPLLRVVVVSMLVFAGVLVRESMALLALVFLVDQIRDRRSLLLAPWPLVAAGAALLVTRTLGTPTMAYAPWAEPLEMVRTKPLWTWLLAWSIAFGPATLALIAAAPRAMTAFAQRAPHLVVYVAGCGLLAFAGGSDTERILSWAFPVVLVALGLAVEAQAATLARARWLFAALAVTVIVSTRILWPIPSGVEAATRFEALSVEPRAVWVVLDKLFVIENYYANLWSYYGSRQVHAARLLLDALVIAGFAWALKRHARAEQPSRRRALAAESHRAGAPQPERARATRADVM